MTILHYAVVIVLVALLAAVAESNALWMSAMPDAVHMAILLLAAVLVAAYAGLVLNEQSRDEREDAHRMTAGRVGYLAGIVTLTLALLMQGFHHRIDAWIPATLAIMIVAKVASRAWADRSY